MSSSNVTLEIAGRRFTTACAPGEERHIEGLGRSISEKLAQLDSLRGQSTERVLLYASLLLADELHEAQKAAAPPIDDGEQAETLEKMADRLEAIAQRLESGRASA
ncbi:cell division protein ZapA [Aurantiacibacter odishensis]|uniref:cell division protein ZapA n=1 Tax=Aurantiacibacter odishensis TaxID=1155476 RepID=UPI000E73E422|nr:cell division protein ZapA [Aurantiacibacter odishensis]